MQAFWQLQIARIVKHRSIVISAIVVFYVFSLRDSIQLTSMWLGSNQGNLLVLLLRVAIIVVLALWFIPQRQAAKSKGTTSKNFFDRENEARKTLAQIIGGVLVLAGFYSSVQTFDLQQQGQITDRFTKAIDQLGALAPGSQTDLCGRAKVNLPIRLGGIYALERIGHDSPKDHWAIMEVLTAYVRENTSTQVHLGQEGKSLNPVDEHSSPLLHECVQVRPDIQAILAVIGNSDIDHEPEDHRLDLSGANLEGANFENVNLKRANLSGTDLLGAVNLKEGQLADTIGDAKTKLPSPLVVGPKEYVVWDRDASRR